MLSKKIPKFEESLDGKQTRRRKSKNFEIFKQRFELKQFILSITGHQLIILNSLGFVNLLLSFWKRSKWTDLNLPITFQLKSLLPSFPNVIFVLFADSPVVIPAYLAELDTVAWNAWEPIRIPAVSSGLREQYFHLTFHSCCHSFTLVLY